MSKKIYKLKDVPRMSTRSFATDTGSADDTEEFATDSWKIQIQQSVKIQADIERDSFKRRPLMEFIRQYSFIPLGKGGRVFFKIVNPRKLNLPKTIKWFWKVRNVGPEAIEHNNIRGKIKKGQSKKDEPLSFPGPHYVEVYGVVDNTVIAFGRQEVPLDQEGDH